MGLKECRAITEIWINITDLDPNQHQFKAWTDSVAMFN